MKATPTRAAIASVAMATLLVLLKAWATLATGSVAMLGSLADAGLDLVAALVTLAAVRIAAIPADHDHRFGHGKAEALAALFQMALVAASAALIAWRALRGFGGDAAPPEHAGAGIAVSLFAMLLTALLLAYQRRVVQATGSIAIRADQLHYKTDFLLNGAVLLALLLEGGFGLRGADPLFGLLIAGWLARGAWLAARIAVDQLMDREWPPEKRRRFLEVASAHPLAGVHDLRTRTAGGTDFVQFHIWLPADMTVAAAHDVMDEIERAIALAPEFAGAEILIHIDPEGQVDAEGVLPSSLAEESAR